MKVLVFCDKITGLELIKTMPLDADEYMFVVGKRDRELILTWLASKDLEWTLIENFHFEIFRDSHFDWLLNLWGSHIFSGAELKKARKSLNIHPGILPGARGSNPVIHSMLSQIKLGVTIHELEDDIDSGGIYCWVETDSSTFITGGEAYKHVVESAIILFSKKWPEIKAGECQAEPKGVVQGKVQTKKETESLRTKNFENLSSDEKSVINWILAFQYNEDYTARIEYKGKIIDLVAKVED